MPSLKAASSSAGATATDFKVPRTSVNHSRTKRMSRSSNVRRTNSCCFSTGSTLCGVAEPDVQRQGRLVRAVDAEQEHVPTELRELERQGRGERHVLRLERAEVEVEADATAGRSVRQVHVDLDGDGFVSGRALAEQGQ